MTTSDYQSPNGYWKPGFWGAMGFEEPFFDHENSFYQRIGILRYTSYIEARYTLIKKTDYQLNFFIGGAIALKGKNGTFYTSRNAMNFVGIQYRTQVKIGNYGVPVQATPAWNPDAKHAYMEVAINLF